MRYSPAQFYHPSVGTGINANCGDRLRASSNVETCVEALEWRMLLSANRYIWPEHALGWRMGEFVTTRRQSLLLFAAAALLVTSAHSRAAKWRTADTMELTTDTLVATVDQE
jgi:hypothetical protein